MMLDLIARRSEESLDDSRTLARQARHRIADDNPSLQVASEELRMILIADVVRMSCDALEDAEAVAAEALQHVDPSEDVLERVRSLFKERILTGLLGEAIREIGGTFDGNEDETHAAVFRKTVRSMARRMENEPEDDPVQPSEPEDQPEYQLEDEQEVLPEIILEAEPAAPAKESTSEWVRLSDIEASLPSGEDTDAEPFAFGWSSEDSDSTAHGDGRLENESDVEVRMPGRAAWDNGPGTTYVYGIMPADGPWEKDLSSVPSIAEGEAVRLVTFGAYHAIVSTVDRMEFEPARLADSSTDTGWLKERIRLHARALDSMKDMNTIVPFRFGTVLNSDDDVRSMLQARSAEFAKTITRLRDRSEWSVRCVLNRDQLLSRVQVSGKDVDESIGLLSEGVAEVIRKELSRSGELDDASLTTTLITHCVERMKLTLSGIADEARSRQLASDGQNEVVMAQAYLVARQAEFEFKSEFQALKTEFEAIGLAFEMTGPWPPFHFVEVDKQEDTAGHEPAIK
jgi:hypothetical protein